MPTTNLCPGTSVMVPRPMVPRPMVPRPMAVPWHSADGADCASGTGTSAYGTLANSTLVDGASVDGASADGASGVPRACLRRWTLATTAPEQDIRENSTTFNFIHILPSFAAQNVQSRQRRDWRAHHARISKFPQSSINPSTPRFICTRFHSFIIASAFSYFSFAFLLRLSCQ